MWGPDIATRVWGPDIATRVWFYFLSFLLCPDLRIGLGRLMFKGDSVTAPVMMRGYMDGRDPGDDTWVVEAPVMIRRC